MSLSPRFQNALSFAAHLHAGQVRKGTSIPYISHLLAVAGLVLEHGGNEDEAIAALLHDAVEDQGGAATREEIRTRFGDRVVNIVDGCTDSDTIPKPPWRERKQAHLDHLRTASPSVKLVSTADKLHNVRCIVEGLRVQGPEVVWSRFKAGPDDQLWYYRECAARLREGWASPLLEELDREVTEMGQLAGLNTPTRGPL